MARALGALGALAVLIAAIVAARSEPAPRRGVEIATRDWRCSRRPAVLRPASFVTRITPAPAEEPRSCGASSDTDAAHEDAGHENVAAIELRDPNGEILEDAWFRAAGHGVLGGRGEIPASPGKSAEVLIKGRFYAARRSVMLDPGLHVISLPFDARVAGRITVTGNEPERPLELRLVSDAYARFYADVETGADGRFEFRRLPRDFAGVLRLPREYRLASDDGATVLPPSSRREFHHWGHPGILGSTWALRIERPKADLEIALVPATAITGRLSDDGGGLAEITVGGERRICRFRACRPKGRFWLNVPPAAERVALELTDRKGLGARRVELSGPFHGITDLGDIELGSRRSLEIRVRDEAGRPVPGALAAIAGTSNRSRKTDDDGACTIRVDAAVARVLVGAVGFRTALVPIDPESDAPVDVVLETDRFLVVTVKLSDGTTPDRGVLYVRVASEAAMFEQRRPDAGWIDYWISESQTLDGRALDSEIRSVDLAPDDEGVAVVPSLRARARLAVQLVARGRNRVLDSASVVVADSGATTVLLRAAIPERIFEGTVTTTDGDLAAGAAIVVLAEPDGGTIAEVRVDSDGSFRLGNVFEPAVSVRITRADCAELRASVSLASPDSEHLFALRPLRR